MRSRQVLILGICLLCLCFDLGCGSEWRNYDSALLIKPGSPLLLLNQTTQLHVVASYADGTSADVTSAAVWQVASPSIASIDPHGLLNCNTAGSTQITAASEGATAATGVSCSELKQIRIGTTPTVVRSNSPYQYQLFADFSDGTTEDVTANAAWAVDPSIASLSSGLLSCNNPGTTSLSAVFLGMAVSTPVTCILQSITPKPGFTESAKTFDGPFQSWVNVKTVFGAKGDGVTDDAPALQRALDSLSNNPAVLWLPRGNYVIRGPLSLQGVAGFTILGEDPMNTSISWYGGTGNTMLTLDGCEYFNIGRITWDGQGSANIAIDVTWSQQGNYYPTHNLIHDSRILNASTGIHLGFAGETTVERIHFDHNTQAGISLGDWDALNFNVVDSLFTDNAFGITNTYGAGTFNVTNSIFVRSTVSDLGIGNTGPFSIRSNLSVDSQMFLSTGMTGAPSNIIIQGNTIDHPHSNPIGIGTPAPVMLLDNRFLHLDPSFHLLSSFCYFPISFISVGNTYDVAQPFVGNLGPYTSIDEASNLSESELSTAVPSEVYIPPLSGRTIFDLASGSSVDMIQSAVDAAIAAGGGVVHIPGGNYSVTKTLKVPSNSSVAILGDGLLTNLIADPSLQGAILSSDGKTIQIEDIQFTGYLSPSTSAIELHVPDRPSTRVFCDECSTTNLQTSGLEVDGLDNASIEFKVGLLNSSVGTTIHGGSARQSGARTLGRVSGFMTGSDEYQVDLGGYFLIEDGWHDTGQGNTQFSLTGGGTVTQQGGTIYSSSSDSSMTLTNYKGSLSLLGVATNSYVKINEGSPSNVYVSATLQVIGQNPILNLEPSAEVTGQVNSSFNLATGPDELADTAVTPSYVEHMLSMARTDRLARRTLPLFDTTTVNLARVFVSGGGVGIQLSSRDITNVGGSYSIKPTIGSMASAQGSCGVGEVSMAGTWTLQDGGDGFFGLSRAGTFLSEDTSKHGNGNSLTIVDTMSSARDRWIQEQVGDGSVMIVNRATGDVLTRSSEDCAYSTHEDTNANQHWLVDYFN